MSRFQYRQATLHDVAAMAKVRAGDWGTPEYWQVRIAAYLNGENNPQHARSSRIAFVATVDDVVVGLIAGHLTQRYKCQGELEWISVKPECRGTGVADELLLRLASWFVSEGARRICVDVQPSNEIARRFYRRHGAEELKPHWMVWNDIGVVR